MSLFVLLFIVLAMLCFLIFTFIKAWRYSHYPLHSRLELYPVPKEGNHRAEYGGSYFEEPEWWKKPRAVDKANETKDILMEMVFIRKLFQNQRSLWWASYAFHLGIYALAVWTVLLIIAALWPVAPLVFLAGLAGGIGFTLATVGALLLLARRLFSPSQRGYTTPQEYFNLILILFVLITGIISWLFLASPVEVTSDLFRLSNPELPPFVVMHLIALGIMFIYIPLSKMSHYVGKFFAFHKVLWDNDPNHEGSQINAQLKEASLQPPAQTSWSAPHINPQIDSDDQSEQ